MEPALSPDIVGAWWFPQDMSIDAQRMFKVLEQACCKAGVEILQGWVEMNLPHYRMSKLLPTSGNVGYRNCSYLIGV